MSEYQFVTVWQISSTLENVWDELYHSENWPGWWKGVVSVDKLSEGDENGVGSVSRYTWQSRLPYKLTFDMRATQVEPPSVLAGVASGDLDGRGIWHFSTDGPMTVARYEWNVHTTKWWMNLLAPIARPLFKWNHNVIMNWGAEGLAKRLNANVTVARES